MDEWVAEAIDLIEWANGDPATNKWAKMRADAGHPAPFNLKYLGLGNEEKISPEFCERFRYIYNKVMEKHPEIVIVGTAGPGSHPGNSDLEEGWKLADELGMPIIDEHYYEPNAYFLSSRQYNYYPRDRKTKVYLGEYAAKDKKLIDALAEGLYLLHVERNGDIVAMTSYAPLFAKKTNTNWNPDMIYFDNERPYLTCSYYVQQLFGQSSGQYYYGDCVQIEDPDAAPRWQGLPEDQESGFLQGQSVVLNVKTRKLYVKLVNASDKEKEAEVNLSRFPIKKTAVKTVITGSANDENNYDKQPIAPKTETIKAKKKFDIDIDPYTMIMLEYSL
jgi:alpha-L-arabinofuranosidase